MATEQSGAELLADGALRGRGGRRFRTTEEWAAVVERFRKSGLTQREFAQREGVKLPTLAYWLSKLRSSETPQPIRFQEVAVAASAGFEAKLPCGTLLRGPSPEGLALLVRLVRS